MDSDNFVLLMGFIINITVGYAIGKPKGRGGEGILLGFLLSFLGWIITACLSPIGPKCPDCQGAVIVGARKCKNCGSMLVDRVTQ